MPSQSAISLLYKGEALMSNHIPSIIEDYLNYCKTQKRLDPKTIKAYRIDLTQFSDFSESLNINALSSSDIECFIGYLNENYKAKTVKRKLASLKTFSNASFILVIFSSSSPASACANEKILSDVCLTPQ